MKLALQLSRLAVLLLLFLSSRPASAQCFQDDLLSQGCWNQTAAGLPALPGTSLTGSGICWDECGVHPQDTIQISFPAPLQIACGRYSTVLNVNDSIGNPLLVSSSMTLDYTRTWKEQWDQNEAYQVWRFVAKVDLGQVAGQAPSCTVADCLQTWPTAFYYGYVDFARRCSDGQFETVIVLFHGCDNFSHLPQISDKPGVLHPGRSFGLVAPSSPLNPFVPANNPAPSGTIQADALRIGPSQGALSCVSEETVRQGTVSQIGQGCGCTFASPVAQVTARHFDGVGDCIDPGAGPSYFVTLDLFPALPWAELMSHSIGSWTTVQSYPGMESVWVDEGPMLFHDSCTTVAGQGTGNSAEFYYGASTDGGYLVLDQENADLTQRFTDLASNYHATLPGPITLPLLGSVSSTEHLIYVNY